ncbi:MAG: DUF3006 domain-containing protein [Gemmatimonadota bacterium]|nr:DUF3006 domain-containing protein [Gemmatimonadota bacterium]
MTGPEIWTVDRVEAGVAVLVPDAGEQVAEVPLSGLPAGTREGSVLRVPDSEGRPDWSAAALDEELRRARLDEAERILQRLKRRDPGGDVVL